MMQSMANRREPAVLLAFSDVSAAQPLRNLAREEREIRAKLEPLVDDGKLELDTLWNATADGVVNELRKDRFRGRFRVFHFGGHAGEDTLLLANDAGEPVLGHARGMADYLGSRDGLELVVLNGCCTRAQVERLVGAGVKAVVATRRAIMDDVAASFAAHFYAELVTQPLGVAFDNAAAAVRGKHGEDPRKLVDTAREKPGDWNQEPPWVLSCTEELKKWLLVSHPKYDQRRVVDVLAPMFADQNAANLVTKRAGVPAIHLPPFTTALQYWNAVVQLAEAGVCEGGVEALLDEAVRMFPYSPKLAELRK
jgi:hypothetical protein